MFFIYVDQKIKVATFPWTYFYIEPNNKKKKKKKKNKKKKKKKKKKKLSQKKQLDNTLHLRSHERYRLR
jgi:hypothetical protein